MYTINYKVTGYNPRTLNGSVATFQHESAAYAWAEQLTLNGFCDVKVYAL